MDRERILALWERCGFRSGPTARPRYDWFYLNNPDGPGRVYLLFNGDGLVGSLGAGTRQIARGPGQPLLRASILVDFVVDPLHRSVFPALQLQRAAREQELRDAQLIYSFPGDKAVAIFQRMGFSAKLTSASYARPLRCARFMKRLLPKIPSLPLRVLCWVVDRARLVPAWLITQAHGLKVGVVPQLPDGIDALWARSGAMEHVATGVRHREYLEWRFHAAQQREWLMLSVTNRRGELEGYFICQRQEGHLCVYDVMLADREGGTLPLLALSLAAWQLRMDSVRVLFGGCSRMQRALLRAGFLRRDSRPCFLIQPPGADADSLPAEWWLTKADEDA